MITAARQEVERWLGRVCRQTDFTGVKLRYHSTSRECEPEPATEQWLRLDQAQSLAGPHARQPMQDTTGVAWQTAVRLQGETLGHLQISLTEQTPLGEPFMRACALAEQISRMAHWYGQRMEVDARAVPGAAWSESALEQGVVRDVVEETLKSVLKLTSYRGVAFFLLQPDGGSLQLKHYLHQELEPLQVTGRELLTADHDRQALLTGLSVCTRQSTLDAQWLPEHVQTGVCVRVSSPCGAIGTLWAYDRRIRNVRDRDLHVVQSIAAQLGVLLSRAVESYQSASHRRLKVELSLAAATQPPKQIAYASPDQRFEAHGLCTSRFDVGGDLCEVIPLDEQRSYVIVGDASGNSIPAAMVMTAVRGAVHALLADEPTVGVQSTPAPLEPARFMGRLNRMLVNMTASHQFMSCICGLFDLGRREFTFCNAGHPAPVHLNQQGVNYLPSHGLLLGIDAAVNYSQAQVTVLPGDVIVLYTDGISEALNQGNRMFRQDGIATAAQLHQHEAPEKITSAIWNRMLAHRSSQHDADDATILSIKLA